LFGVWVVGDTWSEELPEQGAGRAALALSSRSLCVVLVRS